MGGLQAEGWLWNIGRTFFAYIDYIVYSLVKMVLFGIFDLASLTTSSSLLNGIYTRIYVLLGVFMAFKLSFSFIQYMVDPESMSGKSEKGVSKLITRIIVMLIALVALPTLLFNTDGGGGIIQRAQNAFLPMLPRILFGISEDSGVSVSNGSNTEDISDAADVMSVAALQAFFAPTPLLDSKCGDGTYDDSPPITSLDDFIQKVNLACNNIAREDTKEPAKYYRYNYLCIISTVVGILLVIMILGIGIDIAKRIFKMIILEAIAPIPIMSLIDPKSSKDGAFSHWIKSLMSTFIDIFLKLGILYVVIMLIQEIVNKGLFEENPIFGGGALEVLRWSYLTVFLILGLIFFAKEAPKFIKDSLGIKDSGAGLGTGFGAAVGAVGGLVGGRGLAGMATGAVAGANADPKVGAWASGRDTAGQIRTGDKNYKGGFGAELQRRAARTQSVKEAAKYGVTGGDDGTLKKAKGIMEAAEQEEQLAQLAYNEAVQTGGDITGTRASYLAAQGKAADAKKTYEKMSKVGEAYNISRSPQEEMKRNRNVYRIPRQAAQKVGNVASNVLDAARTGVSSAGRATLDAVEKIPIAGQVVRTVDDVAQYAGRSNDNRHQKGMVANIDNKAYFDPGGDIKNEATNKIVENDIAKENIKNDIKDTW